MAEKYQGCQLSTVRRIQDEQLTGNRKDNRQRQLRINTDEPTENKIPLNSQNSYPENI